MGRTDIRHLDKNGPSLQDQIQSFLSSAVSFSKDKQQLKINFLLGKIRENAKRLDELLNKPWNCELKNDAIIEKKKEVRGGDDYIFKPATPLKEKASFSCEDCDYSVSNHVVFKRHVKAKHGKIIKIDPPKATCMLAHQQGGTRVTARHTMDQICSHFKQVCFLFYQQQHNSGQSLNMHFQVHKEEKPTPKHEFRGHESFDKGVNWKIVFLLKDEPNPVSRSINSPRKNLLLNPDFQKAESAGGFSGKVDNAGLDKNELPQLNVTEASKPVKDSEKEKTSARLVIDENVLKADSAGGSSGKVNNLVLDENEENRLPELNVTEDSKHVKDSEKEKTSAGLVLDENVLSSHAAPPPPPVYKVDSLELDPDSTEIESHVTVGESNFKDIREPEKQKNDRMFEINDELCGSYEDKERAIEDDFRTAEDAFEEDSDVESEDEDVYTFTRLRNKMDRYRHRNNPDKVLDENLPENKAFIDEFVAYLRKTSTTQNEKSSTISLSKTLLFTHDDSFLAHRKKKNPSFSLDRLVCFNDLSRFVELQDPASWIDEIGGDNGRDNAVRRKEMFKAFKRMCRFVLMKLGDHDFGTDLMSILRRDKIRTNLKDILEDIDKNRTWTKLQRIIDSDRVEIQKAKTTIDPDHKHNAAKANRTYFASPEFKNRVDKCNQIWEKCLASGKISGQDFNTIGNFPRHLLAMTDRNRSASYHFRNSDFAARKKVWFPVGHNIHKFNGVPDNWNMYEEPSDGRDPDAWTLDLSSNDEILKLGVDVNITILSLAHEWCNKYRDVKNIKWKDVTDDEYFFVSNQRKKYGAMNKTAIMNEYAKVTGLKHVTVNTFRRAMEPQIQGDHTMKTRSKDISSHSEQTGSKYYDETASQFRCAAMHFLNEGEMEYENQSQVPEEIEKKRLKLDEEGKQSHLQKAKMRVVKDPTKRKATTGKSCTVVPADRAYMQSAFGKDGVHSDLNLHDGKFPGKKK